VLQRLQVVAQFVHQGHAGGNVQAGYVLVRDVVQVFDQSAQAVAVRGDDHTLARAHLWGDRLVPVGEHTGHRILEALGGGNLPRLQIRVAAIKAGVTRVVIVQRWGRHVVGSPPDVHLLFAVARRGLCLVEPLQGAVVALVQAPGAVDRYPHQVHLVHDNPQRPDRPFEHRRISDVKLVASGPEQLAGSVGLLDAGR